MSAEKEAEVRLQQALHKLAGSKLREAFKLVPQSLGRSNGGGEIIRWTAHVGDTPVGVMQTVGDQVQVSQLSDKFRGMGLGRKMYGEVMRRMPEQQLRSDASLSDAGKRLWESFAQRGDVAVKKPLINPSLRVEGALLVNGEQAPTTFNQSLLGRSHYRGKLPSEAAHPDASLAGSILPTSREKLDRAVDIAGEVAPSAMIVGGLAGLAHDKYRRKETQKHKVASVGSTMNLFIRPEVQFEKVAAEVELPEDPNTWPKEVLDELFKQVPYISDFQPRVVMDKVDSERRYGLGYVEVSNQSEAPMYSDPNMMEAAGVRSVRIPVIIRDGKLFPFDLLLNDQSVTLPLTESRLRQAIFRPQAFDVTSKMPGDQSMLGQLYPPYRQNYGFGGGGGVSVPADMGKMGSAFEDYLTEKEPVKQASARTEPVVPFRKKASAILKEILPTINSSDLAQFKDTVNADYGLQLQFQKNASAEFSLRMLASCEPMTKEKLASALPNHIRPTVVQVTRANPGYLVKAASHHYWRPTEELLDRGEVIRRFGEKIALAADISGSATLGEDAATEEAPEQSAAALVTEPGLYKVTTTDGTELVGFVIPNLIDTDGAQLPLYLFTNGSQSTVQSEIYGEHSGEGANLPTGPIAGMGAFFCATPEGIKATIPMQLNGSYTSEGEPDTHSGETFDGRPVEVSVQPNIQEPIGTEDGKLLLPQTWQWTPMDKAVNVALAGSEEDFGDADAEKEAMLHIYSDGSTFSFSGAPVEKLASEDRTFLDVDAALFLLTGLGVHQGFGATKLAHAMAGNRSEAVKVGRELTLAKEAEAGALERAREQLAHMPDLRQNLIKEAAMIQDPMAVDTVLSLGFINPENIMTFVSYLPQLDEVQQKLCELLMAARIGLSGLSETALERAVRSVEETLEGLKVIAFSQ